MYTSPSIIIMTKSRRMSWKEHVARIKNYKNIGLHSDKDKQTDKQEIS
jgi:hypothetical protein